MPDDGPGRCALTAVAMARQLCLIYGQISILVKLPEACVDDVKVLVGEVAHLLVDVGLLVDELQHLEKVAPAQLLRCHLP